MIQNSYIQSILRLTSAFLFTSLMAARLNAAETVAPPPPPENLPRTSSAIKVDGDLDDAGWKQALIVDKFYETSPGNNIPAKIKTITYLTYDDSYFYIGIKADDP